MTADELFMLRALELAKLGIGQVSPNPRVGCVVTHNDKIIGEGWHKKFGEAHAEVNAIAAVHDKSWLRESTVYVNLEPCAHVGKTPPCADLLIRHHVKKVVIAHADPNPLVAGRGIEKLRQAGIEVATGVLENEARTVNKRFLTALQKQRPYIILKWAQTHDGFIAKKNYESKWISNVFSRQLVHRWRSEEDAVLVGTQTALHDNPQLTVRDWAGRNPVRIVIDRFLKLKNLSLFDKKIKTICYTVAQQEEQENLIFVQLNEHHFIPELVADLHRRGIQSLMIEGGAQTLQAFIAENLWDEARVFVAPHTFGAGIFAPVLRAKIVGEQTIENNTLKIFNNFNNSRLPLGF